MAQTPRWGLRQPADRPGDEGEGQAAVEGTSRCSTRPRRQGGPARVLRGASGSLGTLEKGNCVPGPHRDEGGGKQQSRVESLGAALGLDAKVVQWGF